MAPPLPVPSRTRLDLASADPLLFSNARDWLRRRGKTVVQKLSPRQKQELEDSFHLMDLDGSGAIDVSELEVALQMLAVAMTRQEAEQFHRAADKDGTGVLEYDEYLELMNDMLMHHISRPETSSKAKLPIALMSTAYRRKRYLKDVFTLDARGLSHLAEMDTIGYRPWKEDMNVPSYWGDKTQWHTRSMSRRRDTPASSQHRSQVDDSAVTASLLSMGLQGPTATQKALARRRGLSLVAACLPEPADTPHTATTRHDRVDSTNSAAGWTHRSESFPLPRPAGSLLSPRATQPPPQPPQAWLRAKATSLPVPRHCSTVSVSGQGGGAQHRRFMRAGTWPAPAPQHEHTGQCERTGQITGPSCISTSNTQRTSHPAGHKLTALEAMQCAISAGEQAMWRTRPLGTYASQAQACSMQQEGLWERWRQRVRTTSQLTAQQQPAVPALQLTHSHSQPSQQLPTHSPRTCIIVPHAHSVSPRPMHIEAHGMSGNRSTQKEGGVLGSDMHGMSGSAAGGVTALIALPSLNLPAQLSASGCSQG